MITVSGGRRPLETILHSIEANNRCDRQTRMGSGQREDMGNKAHLFPQQLQHQWSAMGSSRQARISGGQRETELGSAVSCQNEGSTWCSRDGILRRTIHQIDLPPAPVCDMQHKDENIPRAASTLPVLQVCQQTHQEKPSCDKGRGM